MGEAQIPKRILIVTPEYPPEQWGGLSATVERVSYHCSELGMETHVAHLKVIREYTPLFDENTRSERYKPLGSGNQVLVHRIEVGKEDFTDSKRDLWDCPHTLSIRMMYQSIEKLCSTNDYDLFNSFFLYPMGYVSGMIAGRLNKPHVCALVGNDVKKYMFSPEKVAMCAHGLENADCVVALSKDLMDIADSLTDVWSKGVLIYNSVKIPKEKWTLKNRNKDSFRIGFAGIFKYAKGGPYLLKAVSDLNESGRNVELELLGEVRASEKEVMERMTRRIPAKSRPLIRGPVPREEVNSWLLTLDAFVMPSVSEGCPNILMEALAAGLPCIATTTGATDVLIEDGISGILVPWGDSRAIADKVALLMDNPNLAASLGAAGSKRMESFNLQREKQDWNKVYMNLLAKGTAGL